MIDIHVRSQKQRPDGSYNYDYHAQYGSIRDEEALAEIERAVRRGLRVTVAEYEG